MSNATQLEVLRTLYALARDDRPADLGLVAEAVGLSCVEVDAVLADLERAGMVDGDRVRLTMAGLVVAVSAVSAVPASAVPVSAVPVSAVPVSAGQGRRRGASRRRRAASRAA